MTILELINAQCKVQGVPVKYAEKIEKTSGITEEKDGNIIAAVKNFKENILPVIQEAENTAKKSVEEYEKKHGLKDGKKIDNEDVDDPTKVELPKDLDPAVKALIEHQNKMMAKMAESITFLTESQKKSATLEIVKAKMKGKIDDDFIEDYASRVKLDAENIDVEIENAVKSFTETKQKFINKEIESGNYIPVSGGGIVKDDKDIDAYIESKAKPAESGFAGIKI